VNYPPGEAGALQELREFIGTRTGFLGLFAFFSVFLPLLSKITQLIPMEEYGVYDGVLDYLPPTLLTALATVMTLFAVVMIFTTRGSYKGRGKRDAPRKAWISIRVSLIMLIIYIAIYHFYFNYTQPFVNISKNDLRKLFFEVPLLITYTTFFSHLTQTLMLVAMTKFYRNN
jgi:hypothetical protein